MKRKIKEKAVLKQETKSEIQELFDELFVGELNKKIANVSSQTTGSIDVLESIKKQTAQHSSVICDRIDALKDALQCVGTVDDWGEETLVSFLNQLAQLVVSCKDEVEKHTAFFGVSVEDVTLYESIESIKHQMEEMHQLIEGVENGTLKNEFEKIFKEFERIDKTVSLLQSIDDKLKVLIDAFGEEGLMEKLNNKLNNKQKEIFDELSLHRANAVEVDRKIDSMCVSVEQITSMLSDIEEMRKTEISSLSDSFKLNNGIVLEKVECIILQSKKRFTYITVGMGILLLTNIVMFVMLMIK